MDVSCYIPADLLARYEFYNYNHALEIITQAFPEEWNELLDCLRRFQITIADLQQAGGNETNIPKKIDDVLYPYGWREIRISGDLLIKFYPRQADQRGRFSSQPFEEKTIAQYIDGQPILRKYGASTTWMGKLLYRLDSRRNGGCPILAIGIKKPCIVDWREENHGG